MIASSNRRSRRLAPAVRREQIVEAALEVFARKGIQGATVDDIGARAGVSKGLVYLYYKSKDALMESVLRRLFEMDLARSRALLMQPTSASARLMDYARSFAEGVPRYRAWLPLFHEYYALLGRNRKLRAITAAYYREQEGLLATLLRQGAQAAEMRCEDPETAAVTLLALQEGLILRWMMEPDMTDWSAQAESSMRLWLRGLQCEQHKANRS